MAGERRGRKDSPRPCWVAPSMHLQQVLNGYVCVRCLRWASACAARRAVPALIAGFAARCTTAQSISLFCKTTVRVGGKGSVHGAAAACIHSQRAAGRSAVARVASLSPRRSACACHHSHHCSMMPSGRHEGSARRRAADTTASGCLSSQWKAVRLAVLSARDRKPLRAACRGCRAVAACQGPLRIRQQAGWMHGVSSGSRHLDTLLHVLLVTACANRVEQQATERRQQAQARRAEMQAIGALASGAT